MKKFRTFIIVLCIIALALAIIPFAYEKAMLAAREAQVPERNNDLCKTTRRVFDYADVLTDKQEQKLDQKIAKREAQLGLDIVIVTIDEDVGSDPYDSSYNRTINFAEDFYEYFKFGYDGHISKPNAGDSVGAGVIYVDNWYDLNGYAESAFLSYHGASGDSFFEKAYQIYTDSDRLLELENDVWEYSNTNPYRSYCRMLNHLAADMVSPNVAEVHIKDKWVFILPLVVVAVFVLLNLGKKLGTKTTDMSTYVKGGLGSLAAREDQFISKHTTSRHIESSSSGGGGGHSGGGGGGGHSGGGGRH